MNITGWPVMPEKCASCPFRAGGDVVLANRVRGRTILQASQVCHHPRLHRKKVTHLCRGARDEQLTILHRMGMIAEATDAAFKEASDKYMQAGSKETK